MKSYLVIFSFVVTIWAEEKAVPVIAQQRSDADKQEYDAVPAYYKFSPQKNAQIQEQLLNYNPQVANYAPQISLVSQQHQQQPKYASAPIPAHIMYGFAPQVQQQLEYATQPVAFAQPAQKPQHATRYISPFDGHSEDNFAEFSQEAASFSNPFSTLLNSRMLSQILSKVASDDSAIFKSNAPVLPTYDYQRQARAFDNHFLFNNDIFQKTRLERQIRPKTITERDSSLFGGQSVRPLPVMYFPGRYGYFPFSPSLPAAVGPRKPPLLYNFDIAPQLQHLPTPAINFSPASEVSSFRFSSPLVTYSNQGVLQQLTGKLSAGDSIQVGQESQTAAPKKIASTQQPAVYSQSPQLSHATSQETGAQEYNYASLPQQQQIAYVSVPQRVAYAAQQPQQKAAYASLPKQYYAVAAPQQAAAYPPQQFAYSPSDLQQFAYVLAVPQAGRSAAQPVYVAQQQAKYSNQGENYKK